MKTIIYSCGSGMTSRELRTSVEHRAIDAWFPEVCDGIPYHESELPAVALRLIGKTIVTVSEIIILTLLREIRAGRLEHLELYCGDRRIAIDKQGDLIDPWDGGFFEESFNLRFHDE